MAYQDCIAELARSAGRELSDDEIESIYNRIQASARKLSLGDSPAERVRAAEHAAQGLIKEAEETYRRATSEEAKPGLASIQAQTAKPPEPPIEERIAKPGIAAELARMRDNTGWAQEGGKHLGGKMGVANFSTWIPNEYWWPGRPKGLSEAKAKAAIDKALAGQPLKAAEKRFVEYATDIAESHVAGEQYSPTRAEMKEFDVPVEQADDAALVARAAEADEAGVERAAVQFEDDYAGFMRAVKEIADATEKHAGQEAAAAGEPRALQTEAAGRAGEAAEPEAGGQPAHEYDEQIADARAALASLKDQGVHLLPEDLAEIERRDVAMARVEERGQAYTQSARCLKGST